MLGVFLSVQARCGCPPSGLWYLPVFGCGPGSVPGPEVAASHFFSSSPSSSRVCAASERPRSSETPSEENMHHMSQ